MLARVRLQPPLHREQSRAALEALAYEKCFSQNASCAHSFKIALVCSTSVYVNYAMWADPPLMLARVRQQPPLHRKQGRAALGAVVPKHVLNYLH